MEQLKDVPVHVHCIANYRVSAFFYRYRRDVLGWDNEKARADMEGVWHPEGVWAEFVKGGDRDDLIRIALTEAAERLIVEPEPFITLFKRGDLSVELYAPRGTDTQQPHDQDEAYIVASGSGTFRYGEERVPFQQGDFLFAAAGVPHRFEKFTTDFQTWVIFFGPKGGVFGPKGGVA
jgi:mannose-6-phosphate isomerase-like protein (cupin superfamily)